MKPMTGIKVLDLGQGGVTPWASHMMQDMGASVVKVEPLGGDWLAPLKPNKGGASIVYAGNNHDKEILRLDLKGEADRKRLFALVRESDILLENYRAGKMAKIGLDYASLKRVNPMLVYCSATGYGESGPFRDAPATDTHIQAFSGFVSHTGEFIRWYGWFDRLTAVAIVQGAMLGLLHRRRRKTGLRVDTTMLATALWLQNAQIASAQNAGCSIKSGPSHIYKAIDGKFVISYRDAADEEKFFSLIADIAKQERRSGAEELELTTEAVIRRRSANYWIKALTVEGFNCAPLYRTEDIAVHHAWWTSECFRRERRAVQ